MSRAQIYIMAGIGALAALAYLQGYQLSRALQGQGIATKPRELTA